MPMKNRHHALHTGVAAAGAELIAIPMMGSYSSCIEDRRLVVNSRSSIKEPMQSVEGSRQVKQ